jgi:hypothetical protein
VAPPARWPRAASALVRARSQRRQRNPVRDDVQTPGREADARRRVSRRPAMAAVAVAAIAAVVIPRGSESISLIIRHFSPTSGHPSWLHWPRTPALAATGLQPTSSDVRRQDDGTSVWESSCLWIRLTRTHRHWLRRSRPMPARLVTVCRTDCEHHAARGSARGCTASYVTGHIR